MNDALGLWPLHEADLRLAGRSGLTVKARRRVLEALSAHSGIDLAEVGADAVRMFLGSDPGWMPATRAVYRSHVAEFYRWAVENEYLDGNPTRRIPQVTVHRGLPRPISDEDFRRALAAARPRMRLWLLLGYDAGLRCMEIAALRTDNVGDGALVVLGKGGKERRVPLSERLESELTAWTATNPPGWVFPNPTDPRRHARAVAVSDKVASHLRSLDINCTAHQLRHGFATRVYQRSRDIVLTQRLLGHASIANTQVYAQADMSRAAEVVRGL
jgi:integrase